MLLTGVCLSCVISTKYVGVFTFFSIGVPVKPRVKSAFSVFAARVSNEDGDFTFCISSNTAHENGIDAKLK